MILFLAIAVLGFILYEEYVSKSTPGTVANYASNAGFSGPDLIIAIAIAYAESGGDPNAQGDFDANGNATSIGLWQIHYTVHPEFDPASLTDPQYNANAAFAIYQAAGNSFTDWTTFGGHSTPGIGPYENYLNQAATEVNGDNSDGG